MSGGIISNHDTPVVPTDVANKYYVDLRTTILQGPFVVTLTGSSFTQISTDLTGNFTVNIISVVSNGPSATFLVVKSDSSTYPGFTRTVSIPGTTTNEKLDLKWDPGSGIFLKKTGVNYDGNYKIAIIKNI